GNPDSYANGRKNFPPDALPSDYCMDYPACLNVYVVNNIAQEVRFEGQGAYVFHNAIRIGSSLDEVLKTLGPPTKTLDKQELTFEDVVLYKNIDGKKGYDYY